MQIFWFCCAKCRLPSKLKDLIEPVVLPKWYCVHPWGGKLSEVQLSCKIQSDYYLNGNRYSFYLTRRQFSPDCDDQSTKKPGQFTPAAFWNSRRSFGHYHSAMIFLLIFHPHSRIISTAVRTLQLLHSMPNPKQVSWQKDYSFRYLSGVRIAKTSMKIASFMKDIHHHHPTAQWNFW